jgi:hypothetical protein
VVRWHGPLGAGHRRGPGLRYLAKLNEVPPGGLSCHPKLPPDELPARGSWRTSPDDFADPDYGIRMRSRCEKWTSVDARGRQKRTAGWLPGPKP